MTSYETFEPRDKIRKLLSSIEIDDDGIEKDILEIEDSNGNKIKIPIYLSEEIKSDVLPSLPCIELGLLSVLSEPQDIAAQTRKNTAVIDVHIWYPAMDDVNQVEIGKKISDLIYHLIRTNQSKIEGVYFANVRNTGRVLIETRGHQVFFHRIMEITCMNYSEVR